MFVDNFKYHFLSFLTFMLGFFTCAYAQTDDVIVDEVKSVTKAVEQKLDEMLDSVSVDSITYSLSLDTIYQNVLTVKNDRFIPDPKKSMWLAMAFPGGGQIYNRKYWKLPIIYGGFIGCVYALNWNNTMYRDYSQAYIDIVDSDPNTKSYENFNYLRRVDIEANKERLTELFKRRKNYFRRYRDLSLFCMIGVYALSVIDAYVDAEMSSFDISTELSLKVHPTIISDRYSAMRASGFRDSSYGVKCSLEF